MAIDVIDNEDNFGQWRDKHDNLANKVGDVAALTTPVTTSVVAAVNSVNANVAGTQKAILVKALCLT